jgi:hypothetical protein
VDAGVLFVSPCVPPVGLPESIAVLKKLRVLSRILPITVVAAADEGGAFPLPPDRELMQFLPPEAHILRIPWPSREPIPRLLGLAGQLAFTHSAVVNAVQLAWARRAAARIERELGHLRFGAIITNSSPAAAHVVGWQLRYGARAPVWIQHYSDPLVDPVYRRYQPLSRWIDTAIERRVLARADVVTVTSPETREVILRRHGTRIPELRARICVVPHVYDEAMLAAARDRYPAEMIDAEGLHACYVGHFYGARSVDPLCRWIDWLRAGSSPLLARLRIHLVGSLRPAEANRIRRGYSDVVRVHPTVTYLKSLAVMQAADVLLVVDAQSPDTSVHFPSKLADYLGAGRPIVAFTPRKGATARILSDTGHFIVPPDASDEHYRQLEALIMASRSQHPTPPATYANVAEQYRPLLEVLERRGAA